MTLEELETLIAGFEPARAVLTAVELDLFTALDGKALGVPEIARAIGASERGVAALGEALVGLGLLERREGGALTASADAARLLSRTQPTWRGGVALHANDLWRRLSPLTECVRSGRPAPLPREPQEIMAAQLALHHGKVDLAEAIAAALPLGGKKRVLDVGAGPGTIVAAILRRDPEATATLLDRALALDVARKVLPKAWVKDGRVKLKTGDVLEDLLPAGFDLVLVSELVSHLEPVEVRRVLQRAREALVEGGTVAIRDRWADPGDAAAGLAGLERLVEAPGGRLHARAEIEAALVEAGFETGAAWIEVAGDRAHPILIGAKPRTA